MPHSHHSHSGQFCLHATSTLAEVAARAHSLGFTHFHLSEHVPRQSTAELYPEEIDAGMTPVKLRAQFEDYLIEARKVAHYYRQRGMHVLVGCETENIGAHTIEFLVDLLRQPQSSSSASDDAVRVRPADVGKGRVDYLVGSVHHAHGVPIDFDEATFHRALGCCHTAPPSPSISTSEAPPPPPTEEAKHEALMLSYLDAQLETLQRLQPEVVGHFDLFRLYRPSAAVTRSSEVWDRIRRNVQYAVGYGALFECNAAAFRKGWTTAYPGREILDLILSLNGRLCLSDDSHGVAAVGLNYHRLRDYLVGAGVNEIWYLEQATDADADAGVDDTDAATTTTITPPTRFARGTVAKRLDVRWSTHPFWTRYDDVRRAEGGLQ